MDQEKFTKAYFGGPAARLAPRGYPPDSLIAAIWQGSAAMARLASSPQDACMATVTVARGETSLTPSYG